MSWVGAFLAGMLGGAVGTVLTLLIVTFCVGLLHARSEAEKAVSFGDRGNGRRPVLKMLSRKE